MYQPQKLGNPMDLGVCEIQLFLGNTFLWFPKDNKII